MNFRLVPPVKSVSSVLFIDSTLSVMLHIDGRPPVPGMGHKEGCCFHGAAWSFRHGDRSEAFTRRIIPAVERDG